METTYMASLGCWGASDSSYKEHGTSPEKLKHRSSKQLFLAVDENDMDLLSCFGLPGSSLFRFWRRLLDLDNLVLQEPELPVPSSPVSSVFVCLVLLSLPGVPFSSPAFAVEDPKKKNLFMFQTCGRFIDSPQIESLHRWIVVSKRINYETHLVARLYIRITR